MKLKQYIILGGIILASFLAGYIVPHKKYTHTLVVERRAIKDDWCEEVVNIDTTLISAMSDVCQSTRSEVLNGLYDRRIELLNNLGYN